MNNITSDKAEFEAKYTKQDKSNNPLEYNNHKAIVKSKITVYIYIFLKPSANMSTGILIAAL